MNNGVNAVPGKNRFKRRLVGNVNFIELRAFSRYLLNAVNNLYLAVL